MSLTAATQMGMVIGTAAYMAPEQARGKPVDQRADIWAFGAVLGEMLTGTKAFPGDDVSDTLATVLKSEPALDAVPEAVPARVQRVLRTCLEKDPKQRMQAIGDVRLAMEGRFETTVSAPAETVTAAPQTVWQRPVTMAGAVLASLVVGAIAVWSLMRPGPLPADPVARFAVSLGADQNFTRTGRHVVALSPDGSRIVYVANSQLFG